MFLYNFIKSLTCLYVPSFIFVILEFFSNPTAVHGARLSGLEARMNSVEDQLSDVDARGSEESDNLANERDLDRFILSGNDPSVVPLLNFCLYLYIFKRTSLNLLSDQVLFKTLWLAAIPRTKQS